VKAILKENQNALLSSFSLCYKKLEFPTTKHVEIELN